MFLNDFKLILIQYYNGTFLAFTEANLSMTLSNEIVLIHLFHIS
jgi:hypothetical protein